MANTRVINCIVEATGTSAYGVSLSLNTDLIGNVLSGATSDLAVISGATVNVYGNQYATTSISGTLNALAGDRAVFNALAYQARHADDIDNVAGIHWTKTELDSLYGSGSLDTTYLRLDTTNNPLTGNLLVQHAVSGSGINLDNIRDQSTVNSSADNAMFCSFDAQVGVQGTTNYDHIASHQDRIDYQGSGSLASAYGYLSWPNHVGSGTLIARYGAKINDVSGTGPITNNYGIYVSALSRGANNYAIFVENNLSHFGGIVRVKSAAAGIALDHNSATGNFILSLSPANLTANHRATFQNADGVVAYLSDITGTVTSVTAGTGLAATPSNPITTSGTIALTDTAVTPGSYTNVNLTVDQQGRITAIDNGTLAVNVYNETQIADGISTIYYLTNYAVPGAIRVYIDGIRQPASDDVAPTDVVSFGVAPDLGAVLLFDYEMDLT